MKKGLDGNLQWDTESFIEQIWRDMDGTASNSHIREVLMDIAPMYENVRVKVFVPILLRRDVLRRLHDELELNPGAEALSTESERYG